MVRFRSGVLLIHRKIRCLMATATLQKKFEVSRKELNSAMIERNDEIDAVLTALVAGEHVLLVGPPGTGKSMLADAVCDVLHGSKFTYLMSKFTQPEEIFGPLSLKALQNDEYVRVTKGRLPEAEVVFLDEIFKASSPILNTTLKCLNERVYDDGRGVKSIPMQMCIGASNEWPSNDDANTLSALFDRFLIRRTVKPVSTKSGKEKLRYGTFEKRAFTPISISEVSQARKESAAIPVSDEAKVAFEQIIRELNREGIFPGDRREQKAVKVLRAVAWLSGSDAVSVEHLEILADILWNDPELHPAKCAKAVAKTCDPSSIILADLRKDYESVVTGVDLSPANMQTTKIHEMAQKISQIKAKAKALKSQNAKVKAFIAEVEAKTEELKQAINVFMS